jgi:hypothetical protein
VKAYFFHILVALSQLGNTLLGGYPDESMSARAWRTGRAGKVPGAFTRPLIDFLFVVITLGRDKHHCRTAYESELRRKQLHPHYQGT